MILEAWEIIAYLFGCVWGAIGMRIYMNLEKRDHDKKIESEDDQKEDFVMSDGPFDI